MQCDIEKKYLPEEIFLFEEGDKMYCFELLPLYETVYGTKFITNEDNTKSPNNPISGNPIPKDIIHKMYDQYKEYNIKFNISKYCVADDNIDYDDYFEITCYMDPNNDITKEYFRNEIKKNDSHSESVPSGINHLASVTYTYDKNVNVHYSLPEKTVTLSWIGVYDQRLKGKGKLLLCSSLQTMKNIGITHIVLHALDKSGVDRKLVLYYISLGFKFMKGNEGLMIAELNTVGDKCREVNLPSIE